MEVLDLKRRLKPLYQATPEPAMIEVPPLTCLAIDGLGDPAAAAFSAAMEGLFGVGYTLKFTRKRAGLGPDYPVLPPEALWWVEGEESWDMTARDRWSWRLLLVSPDLLTPAEVLAAATEVARKRKLACPPPVRLERLTEGRCAQVLHVGPYCDEPATIARLHQFIAAQGGRPCGPHHEIYLGDPRRTAPEKLKTILRQPYG